jgi:hypothetical protein
MNFHQGKADWMVAASERNASGALLIAPAVHGNDCANIARNRGWGVNRACALVASGVIYVDLLNRFVNFIETGIVKLAIRFIARYAPSRKVVSGGRLILNVEKMLRGASLVLNQEITLP